MSLDGFFNPRSVAIIGASHTPGKIGYTILENFVRGSYRGRVYAVNPNVEKIFDVRSYPSVKTIQEKVDLAVVAVPAETVPKVLKDCVEKNVKSVIVVSGGFSESGESGWKLEEELKRIIKKTSTRVLGPNCLGVFDAHSRLDTLFHPKERLFRPSAGSIGFVSQSGAVGSVMLDLFAQEHIGISKFISYENAADINECDCIEYLGNDKETKVIIMFVEGVKDGKRFIEIVKKVSRKKPIIVMKGGKTKRGTKAVASHTGSLAGSAKIYSGVFKQTGMIEADNFEELVDFSKAFLQVSPKGNRIAIITDGGGFGVVAVDECERQNLEVPPLPEKIKQKLKEEFPAHAILSNPLDITGDANVERYKRAIEECLKSDAFDGIVLITLFQIPTLEENLVDVLPQFKKYKKPILCCTSGSEFTVKLVRRIEGNGIPVYPTPERAVKAMAALVEYKLR